MKPGIDYTGVCVVYFCHDGQGNVLMAKRGVKARDEQGRWDIGGGALETGETIDQSLRKEIKEEYSATVLAYEFLGYRDVFRTDQGQTSHWLALDFKVLIDPAGVKIGEPHKFDDLKWFKIGQWPSPVHSQLPTFLEKYKDKLK